MVIFEGNGDGPAMNKLARVLNLNYTPEKGYFVDDLTMEKVKIINLPGLLNGKPYNYFIIVEVN